MTNKLVAFLALAGFAFVVAGCNTVEGMGKDVKATGAAVEKAADVGVGDDAICRLQIDAT